jgi:hypothetical protein
LLLLLLLLSEGRSDDKDMRGSKMDPEEVAMVGYIFRSYFASRLSLVYVRVCFVCLFCLFADSPVLDCGFYHQTRIVCGHDGPLESSSEQRACVALGLCERH